MRPRRVAAALLLCVALPAAAPAPGAGQSAPPAARAQAAASAGELLAGLDAAWRARDTAAYLALWEFATVDALAEESAYAERAFAADESQLRLDLPDSVPADREGLAVSGDVFVIEEPRGRVDQWLFSIVKRAAGWRIVAKEAVGRIEGLIHLSLDPQGFKADGHTLRLEDFELLMEQGSLFLSPQQLGPTLLVFVGDGEVRFRPRPDAEKEQLRQFSGRTELVEKVKRALVRLHPGDLHGVLEPVRFEADPGAGARLEQAQRMFRDEGSKAFVLDAAAPRSPWWLLPSLGDAAVVFESRRGTLTFTVSGSEAEGLSLFDRDKRLQICLYPRAGGSTDYSEDAGRPADILDHDLRVAVDPQRELLSGEDTLRIDVGATTATLRLKLDDALEVESVTSPEVGRHLFFRVRNQDLLMVSLGGLSGRIGEIRLTIRYAGVLRPGVIESEVTQVARDPPPGVDISDVPIENVLVYTNREAWYPQGVTDDYATARVRFEVPAGYTAVTGGLRREARVAGDRTLVEYVQDRPGRYITAAIGRFHDMGRSDVDGLPLHTFAVSRQRGGAAETARLAADVLRFYTRLFGPCPYPGLNLVLTEGYAPGGHSPPAMVVLQSRPVLLRSALRDDPANVSDVPGFFLAHELAHQWWGHGLAGQNYRERWLSEGAAQYAAALWAREARGEEAFQSVLRHYARWALRHSERGPIHLGYRLGHVKSDPQVFRALVYDKAAYVLHMLRGIVGPEAFRQALVDLQAEKRFSKIGTRDLREALERASGKDLGAYFREWIHGTRLPSLRVFQRSEGSRLRVEVAAEALPGPVPLEIALSGGAGRRSENVLLEPAGGSWSFDVGGPGRAEVNSDRGLLAKIEKG